LLIAVAAVLVLVEDDVVGAVVDDAFWLVGSLLPLCLISCSVNASQCMLSNYEV
jgi:hypothetical protein